MNTFLYSPAAKEIASIVTQLKDDEQRKILYFVRLRTAKKWAKKLDNETKKIKETRPSIDEINLLVCQTRKSKNVIK